MTKSLMISLSFYVLMVGEQTEISSPPRPELWKRIGLFLAAFSQPEGLRH